MAWAKTKGSVFLLGPRHSEVCSGYRLRRIVGECSVCPAVTTDQVCCVVQVVSLHCESLIAEEGSSQKERRTEQRLRYKGVRYQGEKRRKGKSETSSTVDDNDRVEEPSIDNLTTV